MLRALNIRPKKTVESWEEWKLVAESIWDHKLIGDLITRNLSIIWNVLSPRGVFPPEEIEVFPPIEENQLLANYLDIIQRGWSLRNIITAGRGIWIEGGCWWRCAIRPGGNYLH